MSSFTTRLDANERNIAVGGGFDFWQRGTSLVTSNARPYLADRFSVQVTSSYSVTQSQSTDVPTVAQSGYQSRYSLLLTNGTGASPSSGDAIAIHHRIEGQDYAQIHSKYARVQFWVKSSVAGTYAASLASSGITRTYTAPITINAANTWEKKFIDIAMDTLSADWVFDNTAGLYLTVMLTAGSAKQTSTLNSWTNGTDFYASTSQTQWGATTGATFRIGQFSIIPQNFLLAGASNVDIPFQRAGRTIQQELAMCKRYCEVINKTAAGHIANGYVASTTGAGVILNFEEKRVAPTISFSAASSYNILCGSAQTTCTSIGTSYIDVKSANLSPNATGLSLGQAAILVSNTTTAIIIDAEL